MILGRRRIGLASTFNKKRAHFRAHLRELPMSLTHTRAHKSLMLWRRGRDLNSRTPDEVSGFQDRHVRPLRHPSDVSFQAVTRLRISDAGTFGGTSRSTASAFRDALTWP